MILPAQSIRARCVNVEGSSLIEPFNERTHHIGYSYGLSPAGYDVRIAEDVYLGPGRFTLTSTIERFAMGNDILGIVHDKSTWARRGLAVQNTVLEPGWEGFLTLELSNHGEEEIWIHEGTGIAQVVFHLLYRPTDQPYDGKYQHQEAGPQGPRY